MMCSNTSNCFPNFSHGMCLYPGFTQTNSMTNLNYKIILLLHYHTLRSLICYIDDFITESGTSTFNSFANNTRLFMKHLGNKYTSAMALSSTARVV